MNVSIKELPGLTEVDTLRRIFEASLLNTPLLKKRCRLEPVVKDCEFIGYRHKMTDALWVGFALGIRTGDRMAQQQLGFTLDWTSLKGL